MKLSRIIILFLCAAAMVFVSGCYYLRLQEVKNQLADFDNYYILEESGQLSISAKMPILYPDDIVRIVNSEPTAKEQTKSELYYDYVLEKQYQSAKNEQGDYNIKLRFLFARGKLNKILIDERLFAIIPKNVIIALVRSFGSAKIDVKNLRFSLSVNVDKIHLPDANEVVASLGKPYSQKDNTYAYNYLRKSLNAKNNDNGKLASAEFVFNKDGNCIKCRSKVFGIPFEMDLEKIVQKQKEQLPSGAKTSAGADPCSDGQAVQMEIIVNR